MQHSGRETVLQVGFPHPVCGLVVQATDRGVVAIEFADPQQGSGTAEECGKSPASQHLEVAVDQLREYFAGLRRAFTVPIDFTRATTPFRRRVVEALAQIPYGQTITYAQLAAAAGKPRAIRAAASACAQNPLPILYPCHRVTRSDGSIGEYRGGAELKQALLAMERRAMERRDMERRGMERG